MEIPIKFEPAGRTVFVLPGSEVLEAAGRVGLAVQTPCGGGATCGKCRVRFVTNPPDPLDADRAKLSADQIAAGWRLACQHTLDAEATLYVPPESVYGTAEQILTSDGDIAVEVCPAVQRLTVSMDPPTLKDARPDWGRLCDAIGRPGLSMPADLLARLPAVLRESGWTVTVTLADGRIADIAGGKVDGPLYGAAFDIGTTTLVGTLMNLSDGSEVAVSARINPQVVCGDDVVSRIMFARDADDGLRQLHESIIEAVGQMVAELAEQAGIKPTDVLEVTIAGNTTMQLLFAGVSPAPLGEIPFVPAFTDGRLINAGSLKLPIHPRGRIYLMPAIGGFLGGDTVAGVLATALDHVPGPALLIDIGTNGEIVLAHHGELWGASTAAGPAFEGARITQGMRAAAGAIEKVIIDDDVQINVIGNVTPVGLCGTALIDAVAGLLDKGVIESMGRLGGDGDVRPALAARLSGQGADVRFTLADGGGNGPVFLTQKDVRELQLASGAIRVGVNILLKRAGLRPEQLKAVYLAGAFGNYIRRANARRIGLLPDLPLERIHFVGNASSMGAKLALLSTNARRKAEESAVRIQRVDLSADPEFQMLFAEAMIFPERVAAC